MDGVTILYEYTKFSDVAGFIILLGAVAAFLGILLVCISDPGDRKLEWVLCGVGILSGIILCSLGILRPRDKYVMALVSPSVTYIDLTEHYDVKGIDGSIYTMKVKGGNDPCTSSSSAESAGINFTSPPVKTSPTY